jgi:hypothetical protein
MVEEDEMGEAVSRYVLFEMSMIQGLGGSNVVGGAELGEE